MRIKNKKLLIIIIVIILIVLFFILYSSYKNIESFATKPPVCPNGGYKDWKGVCTVKIAVCDSEAYYNEKGYGNNGNKKRKIPTCYRNPSCKDVTYNGKIYKGVFNNQKQKCEYESDALKSKDIIGADAKIVNGKLLYNRFNCPNEKNFPKYQYDNKTGSCVADPVKCPGKYVLNNNSYAGWKGYTNGWCELKEK